MNPKKIKNEQFGEEYYHMKHPSGLDIYAYPKKGFSTNYAIFGTHFGSVNNKFKIKGETSYTEVPDGIAHFLEHKLFDGKDGDAFTLFSKTGASANAFTNFERTAYLFSCTENFESSLEILLNFVQNPYFTEKSVQKEQGIIGQEIKMYEDDPDWNVFLNGLKALYKNHPVNIDIAGTVETIAKITPEMLYACYNAYYNLNNMSLCLVGDFDAEKIIAAVDKKLIYSKPLEAETFFPEEPREVAQKLIEKQMDISTPLFFLGYKEVPQPPSNKLVALNGILMKIIASKTSPMYNKLLDEKLINTSTFNADSSFGPNYSCFAFSGESKNPEKAAEIIRKSIKNLKETGISSTTFERQKKAVCGKVVSLFNNVSGIANVLMDCSFYGREFFDYFDALSSITLEDINNYLQTVLDEKYSALSVVKPKS